MLNDQRDEVVLIGGERAALDEARQSVRGGFAVETHERANERAKTARGVFCPSQIIRLSDAIGDEHLLEFIQIGLGQLAISAQLSKSDVIFVCSHIGPGFLAEPLFVGRDADAPHVHLSDLADLVNEVGIDDRAQATAGKGVKPLL